MPTAVSTFIAIDFETATTRRDSACAVALVACSGGRVALARTYLIRPPNHRFTFSTLHGLTWSDVRDAPTFAELWPVLRAWIDGAEFVAAHNAPFDRSVLHACCARYRLRPSRTRFTCTVQLARAQWGIRPTKLPDVCRRLGIPLLHHDPASDAAACARIVLAAEAEGWRPRRGAVRSRRRIRGEAGSAQSRTSRTRAAPRPHERDSPRPESAAMILIGNCPPRPQRLRWRAVALTLQTWWRRLREAIRQTVH